MATLIAFSPGLPPPGRSGAFLGRDGRGGLWLLRWDEREQSFSALGYPGLGDPEQHYLGRGTLTVVAFAELTIDPIDDAGWSDVAPAHALT